MSHQPDGQDLVSVLVEDHREVEALFARFDALPPGDPRRRQVADAAIAELVRHSVAEEMYLYPTTRRALPDGDDLADHEIDEHATAERTMKQVEGVDVTDPRFGPAAAEQGAGPRDRAGGPAARRPHRARAARLSRLR